MKIKGVLLFAILALVFTSAVSAIAQDVPPPGAKFAPFPNPQPGSWWVIKGTTAEWQTRVELKRVENGKFITERGGREIEYTNEWNAFEDGWDQRTIRTKYSPHVRNFSFPLWPGKKWGGIVEWTGRAMLMTGGTYSEWAEAKRWERIRVPAGEFEAMRIENLRGKIQSTCWYAVEVQRLVKCVSPTHPQTSWELIEFHLVGSPTAVQSEAVKLQEGGRR